MDDKVGVRNTSRGVVRGPVVQAGSIHQVSLGVGTPPAGPPRQLPLAIGDFTGRTEQIAELDRLLHAKNSPETVVISAVDGAAGIGKTTLAVWWAHRVEHRFPDGTLYVNLRGYGPGAPATASEVLEGFLRALGSPAGAVPRGVDAQAGLYRSLLAGRRVLVVLDNANSADQVRPLLPGAAGCVVLVTSRDSLTGLVVTEGARRFTLDLLSEPESVELVRGIVGTKRVNAEPDAVAELVRLCARLPLALRIAAGRAVGPHTSVPDVVAELADDRYRLDALSRSGDERAAVRAVFDWSYQQLDPLQARVFRCLGLHPGPEISLHAAAAVAGLELAEARRRMDALSDGHLIELVGRGRYRFHDLLRAYASDRAQDMAEDERAQAMERILSWYTWHSVAANRTLYVATASWNPFLDSVARSGPEIDLRAQFDAWSWFITESANLNALVRAAHLHGLHQFTAQLAYVVSFSALGTRDLKIRIATANLGLSGARCHGDPVGEFHALLNLSEAYINAEDWRVAVESARAALELARNIGDPWLEAGALNDLALVCLHLNLHAQAEKHLQDGLPLSVGAQGGRLEGVIEGNLSSVYVGYRDYEAALQHAERALEMRRIAKEGNGELFGLHKIAVVKQKLGRHLEVIALCEQGFERAEPHILTAPHSAEVLVTLGTSLNCLNDFERALTCWRDALAIYERWSDPRAETLRNRIRAANQSLKHKADGRANEGPG